MTETTPTSRTRRVAGVATALLATVVVGLGWVLVRGLFQIGADTGDQSEDNAGAAVVGAVLALVLVPLSAVVVVAWARPARRLRWSARLVGGVVAVVALWVVYLTVFEGL